MSWCSCRGSISWFLCRGASSPAVGWLTKPGGENAPTFRSAVMLSQSESTEIRVDATPTVVSGGRAVRRGLHLAGERRRRQSRPSRLDREVLPGRIRWFQPQSYPSSRRTLFAGVQLAQPVGRRACHEHVRQRLAQVAPDLGRGSGSAGTVGRHRGRSVGPPRRTRHVGAGDADHRDPPVGCRHDPVRGT